MEQKERNNYCIDILDTLLQEDDENEEIWYYMSNCYYNIHKYTLAKEFGEGCQAVCLFGGELRCIESSKAFERE